MPKNNTPEPADKAREDFVREQFEKLVESLQPLNRAERIRLLRTAAVFFNLEQQAQFE